MAVYRHLAHLWHLWRFLTRLIYTRKYKRHRITVEKMQWNYMQKYTLFFWWKKFLSIYSCFKFVTYVTKPVKPSNTAIFVWHKFFWPKKYVTSFLKNRVKSGFWCDIFFFEKRHIFIPERDLRRVFTEIDTDWHCWKIPIKSKIVPQRPC